MKQGHTIGSKTRQRAGFYYYDFKLGWNFPIVSNRSAVVGIGLIFKRSHRPGEWERTDNYNFCWNDEFTARRAIRIPAFTTIASSACQLVIDKLALTPHNPLLYTINNALRSIEVLQRIPTRSPSASRRYQAVFRRDKLEDIFSRISLCKK